MEDKEAEEYFGEKEPFFKARLRLRNIRCLYIYILVLCYINYNIFVNGNIDSKI